MNEDQRQARRNSNQLQVRDIAYVLYCAGVVIGGYYGVAAVYEKIMAFCTVPVITWLFVVYLRNFIADIFQYRREDWNFDQRQTRSEFDAGGEGETRAMSPFAAMVFGYPMSILTTGVLSVVAWGCVLGFWKFGY